MGHTALVKAKLVALLTSEVVAVVNMHHVAISVSSDINDEGLYIMSVMLSIIQCLKII